MSAHDKDEEHGHGEDAVVEEIANGNGGIAVADGGDYPIPAFINVINNADVSPSTLSEGEGEEQQHHNHSHDQYQQHQQQHFEQPYYNQYQQQQFNGHPYLLQQPEDQGQPFITYTAYTNYGREEPQDEESVRTSHISDRTHNAGFFSLRFFTMFVVAMILAIIIGKVPMPFMGYSL